MSDIEPRDWYAHTFIFLTLWGIASFSKEAGLRYADGCKTWTFNIANIGKGRRLSPRIFTKIVFLYCYFLPPSHFRFKRSNNTKHSDIEQYVKLFISILAELKQVK